MREACLNKVLLYYTILLSYDFDTISLKWKFYICHTKLLLVLWRAYTARSEFQPAVSLAGIPARPKGRFPLGGLILRTRSGIFLCLVISRVELIIEKTKRNSAQRGKFRPVENGLQDKILLKHSKQLHDIN